MLNRVKKFLFKLNNINKKGQKFKNTNKSFNSKQRISGYCPCNLLITNRIPFLGHNNKYLNFFLNYNRFDFDFRSFTNPQDTLSYLFEEWVPCYRMKYAICKILNPASILEIGVRYGYSAITFLSASPNARYLGISNDTSTPSNSIGAIQWAKRITRGYNAEFVIADKEMITILPGERWDLIHIDNQQTGDVTYNNLELALQKATWILFNGYFLSNENWYAATHFLRKYRAFIEHATIIPDYEGVILIKVRKPPADRVSSYSELSEAYDREYFENDCGGYASFKKTKGKYLEDPRLIAGYLLAEPVHGKRILDIGCGRGELCYALAKSGAHVTGIDYSETAIAIAKSHFQDAELAGSLTFICADAINFKPDGLYDVIIGTDIVEHIEDVALERLLLTCANHLYPDGRLILHTAPNLLHYQVHYPEIRRKAREAWCYLPQNPRSYYEDLMHINEQTPDSLKAKLIKFFDNSIIWVANHDDMVGSLGKEYTEDMVYASQGIFSVASHNPLSKEAILSLLTQDALEREGIAIKFVAPHRIDNMVAGMEFYLPVNLQNNGKERLASLLPYPVHISYHWRDESGDPILLDGVRTSITPPLTPHTARDIDVRIIAPDTPGSYTLELTLVQESCFWFEEILDYLPYRVNCTFCEQEKMNVTTMGQ